MSLTNDDLKILCEPLPSEKIGVKVQSLSKSRDRALLVLYLQHTDVYDRLERVDPSWTATSLEVKDVSRDGENLIVCRMRLTLKGVERENVGEGYDDKSAFSDAFKRCAMLFGVGRYLYDQEMTWVPYNEQADKYKTWSYEEYEKATGKKKATTTRKENRNHVGNPTSLSGDSSGSAPKDRSSGFIIPIGTHKGKGLETFTKPDATKWLKQILAAQAKGKAVEKEWTTVVHKLMEYVGYTDQINGSTK